VLDGKVWERRKEQPYNRSKVLRAVGCLGATQRRVRVRGCRSTQESQNSRDNLVSCCLIRPLSRSTLPEDWGVVWSVESSHDGQVSTD
jgi:hypothetical protein